MKNVTLAIDDGLVEEGRAYARAHGSSLNELIRQLLERTVRHDSAPRIEEIFRLMDEHPGKTPEGYTFRREDAYDV